MFKISVVVSLFVLSTSAFASSPELTSLPVEKGSLTQVLSVQLQRTEFPPPRVGTPLPPYRATLVATVQYMAGCQGPTSFVVIPNGDRVTFTLIEAHKPLPPGRMACNAIHVARQNVPVTSFFEAEPNPALITVNGIGINQ